MEILSILDKYGVSLFWGIMLYFLLKEIIQKIFNGFNNRIEQLINELQDIKEEFKEIKEVLKEIEIKTRERL